MMACYQQLHDSGAMLASCSKVWHVEASGAVYDPKYHAGASNLLRRKTTSISKSKPPFVKTNIETIAIKVGRQTLHFFPDRVLVLTVTVSVLLVMTNYSLTLVIVSSLKAKVCPEMP